MSLLQEFMRVYRHAFHPLPVLAASSLLLVYEGWAGSSSSRRSLLVRLGAALGVEAVAVSPVAVYLLVAGTSVDALTLGNDWRADVLTTTSLLVAAGLLWYVWAAMDWGSEMRRAAETIVVVAVPYLLVSFVWNVSGHVTFTVVPTLFLTLRRRSYWPLLLIPLLMVPNRPIVGVHTWAQSVGGLLLGTVGVLAADRWTATSEEADSPLQA